MSADGDWHRTQRVPNQSSRKIACTIASFLSAMAAVTRGRIGPSVTLDHFRELQYDRSGGIDLYDGKYAAGRLGVPFTVFASFPPGPEYPETVRANLRDNSSATVDQAMQLLRDRRFLVLAIDYSKLPESWWRDRAFARSSDPAHAIALLGIHKGQWTWEVLLSDPLDTQARWRPAAPVWAAAAAYAGQGRVWLATTGIRPPLRTAGVRPLSRWTPFTQRGDGSWARGARRTTVTGFHASASEPFLATVANDRLRLIRIESGGYAGTAIALERIVDGQARKVWGTWSQTID